MVDTKLSPVSDERRAAGYEALGEQSATWITAECVIFRRTRDRYGGLSNMAAGYPLRVNGIDVPTTESLYQALRYPKLPEVQRRIIATANPMAAKRIAIAHYPHTRPDWYDIRVEVMRWVSGVKLAQNWERFSELLTSTANRPIVEFSYRDDFWGAKPSSQDNLIGVNMLGQILMHLRDVVRNWDRPSTITVQPPDIAKLLLYEEPLGPITSDYQG